MRSDAASFRGPSREAAPERFGASACLAARPRRWRAGVKDLPEGRRSAVRRVSVIAPETEGCGRPLPKAHLPAREMFASRRSIATFFSPRARASGMAAPDRTGSSGKRD